MSAGGDKGIGTLASNLPPIFLSKFLANEADFEYYELHTIVPCVPIWIKKVKSCPVDDVFMVENRLLVNQNAYNKLLAVMKQIEPPEVNDG